MRYKPMTAGAGGDISSSYNFPESSALLPVDTNICRSLLMVTPAATSYRIPLN